MAAKAKKTSTAKKNTKTASPAVIAAVASVAKPVATPVVKPVAPVAPVAKPVVAPPAKPVMNAERAKMIEVAAYLLAEKSGFRGDARSFWLQAEKEVDAKLGKK